MNEQTHVNPSAPENSEEAAHDSSTAAAPETSKATSDSASPKGKSTSRQPSMAQVMASDKYMPDTPEKNSLVTGTIMQIDDSTGEILVDIGAKSEGVINKNEIGDDPVSIGDSVEALVIEKEDAGGRPVLSKRRADYERLWRDLQNAKQEGRDLQATVSRDVKGGIIVDLGVSAFVPASHVWGRGRSLKQMVGKTIPVRIIELNRRKDKVIASNRIAVEEERAKREAETWAKLEKGKIVEGIVRRITDFGAFVDLGGLDGLLHVREMAWSRVDHPENVVKRGQKLQLLILDLDEERKRVALGLKQLQSDPWKTVGEKYKRDQIVEGKITHLAATCAFIELEEGIEAIIPIGEISEEHIKSPSDVLKVGAQVEGRIKRVQADRRRMTVSLRSATRDREQRDTRSAIKEVNKRATSGEGVRLGDIFGDQLREARDRVRDRKKSRDSARRRALEAAEEEEDWEEVAAAETEVSEEEILPDVAAGDADVDVPDAVAKGGELKNSLADQLKAALAAAKSDKGSDEKETSAGDAEEK